MKMSRILCSTSSWVKRYFFGRMLDDAFVLHVCGLEEYFVLDFVTNWFETN